MPPGENRNPNVIDVQLALLPGQSEVAVARLTQEIQALNEHLAAAALPNAVANIQGANRAIQTSTANRQTAIHETGRSPGAAGTQGGAGTVSQPDGAAGQGASRGGPKDAAQAPTAPRTGTSSGAGDGIVQLNERTFRNRLGLFSRAATRGEYPKETPTAQGFEPDQTQGRLANLADFAIGMARSPGRISETDDERDITGQRARPRQASAPSDGERSPTASAGGPGTEARPIYGPNGEIISSVGTGAVGDSGGSGGASRDGDGDLQPSWTRHVRMQNLEDQMQWPRLGELTTQNKLQMASDWLARNQLQRNDRLGDDTNQWRGRAAAAFGIATNNYTQIRAAHEELRKAAAAIGVTREGERGQAALGYSQQGAGVWTIPGTEVGGEIPVLGPLLSEAGRQNIKRNFETLRLSTQAQISKQESAAIMEGLEARGYSGSERDNMAFNFLAPLSRQGLSPEVAMSVSDQAYRYGNTSLDDLRKTLTNLGDAARTTKQTVDQVAEGLGEFATTAAEHGATVGAGLRTGREFLDTTGQRPEIAARALQNPLFQGLAMQQTGLLPAQQGTMTGTEIAGVQARMVNMAMAMTRGFNRPRTVTTTDAQGRTITRHVGGLDAQIAQAASMVGMDPDTFRQTLRHQTHQARYSAADNALEAWNDDVNRAGAGKETGDRASRATAAENALQRGAGGRNHLNWHDVARDLADAGVSKDRIRDIGHESFANRVKDARKELEKQTDAKRSTSTVEIRFSGAAEKILVGKVLNNDSQGHSNTSLWKTAKGVGMDAGKFLAKPDVQGAVKVGEDIISAFS